MLILFRRKRGYVQEIPATSAAVLALPSGHRRSSYFSSSTSSDSMSPLISRSCMSQQQLICQLLILKVLLRCADQHLTDSGKARKSRSWRAHSFSEKSHWRTMFSSLPREKTAWSFVLLVIGCVRHCDGELNRGCGRLHQLAFPEG